MCIYGRLLWGGGSVDGGGLDPDQKKKRSAVSATRMGRLLTSSNAA